jgi:hypothetical protein
MFIIFYYLSLRILFLCIFCNKGTVLKKLAFLLICHFTVGKKSWPIYIKDQRKLHHHTFFPSFFYTLLSMHCYKYLEHFAV